jgi:hypothetical protein
VVWEGWSRKTPPIPIGGHLAFPAPSRIWRARRTHQLGARWRPAGANTREPTA